MITWVNCCYPITDNMVCVRNHIWQMQNSSMSTNFSFMNFVSNYKTWKYLFSYSAMNIKSVIYCKETMKCRKIKDQSWRNWNDIIDKGILLIWTLIVSSKRNAKCLRCWMYLITTQKMHASKLYKSAQENLIFKKI